MFKSFLLILIASLPFLVKAQVNESNKPTLEIRRVIYDIDEGTMIGSVIKKKEKVENIELTRFGVNYGILFKRNNDFYEGSLKETVEKAFVQLKYPVVGYGNIFTELQPAQTSDFALAFVVDSVAFNYSNMVFAIAEHFQSKTYVTVSVIDLNIEKIVMDTSFVSEYYSEDIGYANSTGNFRNYFNGTLEQIARDVSESEQFKSAVLAHSESKNTRVTGDTIYLSPNKQLLDKTVELKNAIESTVTIKSGNAHGSGTVISNDGLILTCNHVVKGKGEVQIILSNHMEVTGKVIRQNADYDVALVKIENITTQPVKLGTETFPQSMETVWVIGTPGNTDLGQSITKGIVSGNRTIEGKQYIQTDASISPGNSGGPLLNDAGQLIGIVNAKAVGKGVEGLGFAIPVSVALEKLNVVR